MGGVEEGFPDFLPDGRLVFVGREHGRPGRVFLHKLDAGLPQPITPEDTDLAGVSPDGRQIAVLDKDKVVWIYPVEGGKPRRVPAPPQKTGYFWPWSSDGLSLFVEERSPLSVRLFRFDLATGQRTLWKEIKPADPAGIFWFNSLPGADGHSYVHNYRRSLGSLYIIEGLR